MQVLKKDIKDTLILAALHEFQQQGFEKASMRNIAKASNMTIGNIYRYYPNKQALFEFIVEPAFSEYQNSINIIKNKLSIRDDTEDGPSIEYFDGVESTIIHLIKSFTPQMSLLFTGSTGSAYQCVKQELVFLSYMVTKSIFSNVIADMINENSYYDRLAHIIAQTLIDSICTILKTDCDNKEHFDKLIDHIIETYSYSIKIATN
ncbi:MAG: TetR/AcrR family transcriptional regulator [Lacrimispora celerecrescens]|uniref:TetR/AcrR family transcriptional regulator n=1 Tax=Lacrimispora indolis TaxID=69825 RepID=UPI000462A857|nr:TetR/AcrR family transcriptional regulator [[Clostridium] methoxybenzovorans]MBE7720513.1 TetR/AcrR family transcriptional regulator [Lacrimispora celerecrescens]